MRRTVRVLAVRAAFALAALAACALAAPQVAVAQSLGGGGATVVKLKLDKVTDLSASRVKLEGAYTNVTTVGAAALSKDTWREGVILLSAADRARKAGNASAASKLANEANARFDLAKMQAGGVTMTSSGLAGLKADATLGAFVTAADTAFGSTTSATLTGSTSYWSTHDSTWFEPETM